MTPTPNSINNNAQQLQGANPEFQKFKDLLFTCLANWYWFVISVVVIVAAAAFYLHRCVPLYERSAKVLIKTETKGGSAADFDFSDLGLVSSNTKVTNEVSASPRPPAPSTSARRRPMTAISPRPSTSRAAACRTWPRASANA